MFIKIFLIKILLLSCSSTILEASAFLSHKKWIIHSPSILPKDGPSEFKKELQKVCKQLRLSTSLPIVTKRSELPHDQKTDFFLVSVHTKLHTETTHSFYKEVFFRSFYAAQVAFLFAPAKLLVKSLPYLAAHTALSAVGYGVIWLPSLRRRLLPPRVGVFHAQYQPDKSKPIFEEHSEELTFTKSLLSFEQKLNLKNKKEERKSQFLTRALRTLQTVSSLLLPHLVGTYLDLQKSFQRYKIDLETFYSMADVPASTPLKKAYRLGARRLHPDKNIGSTESATQNFQVFKNLYDNLRRI